MKDFIQLTLCNYNEIVTITMMILTLKFLWEMLTEDN